MFGIGLFLLPLEFVPGELEAVEGAGGADELKPKLRLFFDALGQGGDVETVEEVEQVKLSDGNGGGVEMVQVPVFGEFAGHLLLCGKAIDALLIADPALEGAFGVGSEIGSSDRGMAGGREPLEDLRKRFVVVDELVDLLADGGGKALDWVAAAGRGRRIKITIMIMIMREGRICDHKIERLFTFGFRKLLMLKVRFLDPPPLSYGFVQFWFRDSGPRMKEPGLNR